MGRAPAASLSLLGLLTPSKLLVHLRGEDEHHGFSGGETETRTGG